MSTRKRRYSYTDRDQLDDEKETNAIQVREEL